MSWRVRRAAVLGSGVMGSAIAGHLANAGVPTLVLDVVPRELRDDERTAGLTLADRRVRDRIAAESVRALAHARPAPLFSPARLSLIDTGNLEDDLTRLAEADWVIEAVREEMSIKREVLGAVAPHLGEHAVLSSNTSGLSLNEMARALPQGRRSRFLGTHFFNPPRYMRLVEVIPAADTDPQVTGSVAAFCRDRLGKGVVEARDTPNFIANRVGLHALMVALDVMERMGLSVEDVDALTGPAMARPRTGTFRLADLVGLDTMVAVTRNTYEAVPGDESREAFVAPDFLTRMVERGLLGRKSGAGFYKKDRGGAILTYDPAASGYRERREPDLPGLDAVLKRPGPDERLRALIGAGGRTGEAAWALLAPTLSYAAMRLEEIAGDAATVDRALELGFNWELGPFAAWDALGFPATAERLERDGLPLPPWIDALRRHGATRLFTDSDEGRVTPLPRPGGLAAVEQDPRRVDLDRLRRAGREVARNDSASLLDLGRGVLGLEFHTKMNAIDDATMEMMSAAAAEAARDWRALVVANDGPHFCAGANLKLLLELAEASDWERIDAMIRAFQQACGALESCPVPVVTAPHGMVLGGGCEVALAGHLTQAAAETYAGLVEVGAGLIPAGGGCLRLYRRLVDGRPETAPLDPALRQAFETIGKAVVSTSAEDARRLGFLRPGDRWSMNREHLTADARDLALALAEAAFAPPPPAPLPVMGRGGIAVIESALVNMVEGRFISEHDALIGRELACVLAGGDVAGPTEAAETHVLDLEREAFLRLCGEPKTRQRMRALMTTGKPLRN